MLPSCVVYDGLPIGSGGAHGLGRISAAEAYASWWHFLRACTEPAAVEAWFDFPRTPEVVADPAVVRAVTEAFPANPRSARRRAIPIDRLTDAISLFETLEPLPTNRWGMAPVWLWFTADVRLRLPHAEVLWPSQDPALFASFRTPGGVTLGASSTRLVLHAKRSLGLSLSFPEATDEQLHEAGPWLQAELPMRLSAKHWTRWTLTKDGRSYRGTRLAPDGPSARS